MGVTKRPQRPNEPDTFVTLKELRNGKCSGLDADLLDFLPKFGCLTTTQETCQLMCHQGDENPGKNGESYVSLWSGHYKMAVFSAAVIKKPENPRKKLPARPDWRQNIIAQAVDSSVDFDDLNMFSEFDRGHLLPYGYAKDGDQGWATMTTANAVPQDRVFNQGVWNAVEKNVKVHINDCHKLQAQGYKAILVTGAVPDYFGEGTRDSVFRVKKTMMNQVGTKPASRADPVPDFNPMINDGIDDELQDGLTVPTHMWTQFVCVKPSSTMTVRSRVSFIGLNYRTGIVKRYGATSSGISATLKTMYGNSLGSYSSGNKMEQSEKKVPRDRFNMKHVKVCHQSERLDLDLMRCNPHSRNNDATFWNGVNVKQIRRENEHNRLGYLLAQF